MEEGNIFKAIELAVERATDEKAKRLVALTLFGFWKIRKLAGYEQLALTLAQELRPRMVKERHLHQMTLVAMVFPENTAEEDAQMPEFFATFLLKGPLEQHLAETFQTTSAWIDDPDFFNSEAMKKLAVMETVDQLETCQEYFVLVTPEGTGVSEFKLSVEKAIWVYFTASRHSVTHLGKDGTVIYSREEELRAVKCEEFYPRKEIPSYVTVLVM